MELMLMGEEQLVLHMAAKIMILDLTAGGIHSVGVMGI